MLFFAVFAVHTHMYGQNVAVKNNLLYDLTLTPNLSVEVGLAPKFTMDLQTGLNLFTLGDDKKLKHYLIKPNCVWSANGLNGCSWGRLRMEAVQRRGFQIAFRVDPIWINHSTRVVYCALPVWAICGYGQPLDLEDSAGLACPYYVR